MSGALLLIYHISLSFVASGAVFARQSSLDKIVATCLGEQNLSGVTTSLQLRHSTVDDVARV